MDWSSAATLQKFRRRVMKWFGENARDLPWRRTRDIYHVWVSEIMLQQTQVATVISYFRRFVDRFPDIESLATADEQEVLRHWEGLGYYRRARQLHAAAKKIVKEHGGTFPTDLLEVRNLPGIGRYTAGAILSIAHDVRAPILEANTIRLLCRLLPLKSDPRQSESQKLLWDFSERLLPVRNVGLFNQGLMELGSEICTPRAPRCTDCPVMDLCPTRTQGWQQSIPLPKQKKVYENLIEAALVIASSDDGQILMRRCGPEERWAGLWDFPRFSVSADHDASVQAELKSHIQSKASMDVEPLQFLARIKHGVTRYRITLLCYRAALPQHTRHPLPDDWRWVAREELDAFPLSSTGRRICKMLKNCEQHS